MDKICLNFDSCLEVKLHNIHVDLNGQICLNFGSCLEVKLHNIHVDLNRQNLSKFWQLSRGQTPQYTCRSKWTIFV